MLTILAVSRWLAASHAKMLAAFLPVVQVDDQAFERMMRSATHINPTGKIIALSVGLLAGLDNYSHPPYPNIIFRM